MKKILLTLISTSLVCLLGIVAYSIAATDELSTKIKKTHDDSSFIGSQSCRPCHEKFYKLWSNSNHGLAMQPYNAEFAKKNLTPQIEKITIGKSVYLAEINAEQGWVKETTEDIEKKYKIAHVMGGKNVYYFLTLMEKGRLQILPISYDVRKEQWFDTSGSGIRHFPEHSSERIDWKDTAYTFNTSCYSCHVSQLSRNYDIETDTYHTTWAEPGINCETCHGPSTEHVKLFIEAEKTGKEPDTLGLISTSVFSKEQLNSMCLSCHAKQVSISDSFKSGDRYFDHFGLVTFEHTDYYPDGRDLGENYTYTSWLMSKCIKSEEMDCLHCHTSSGRYRFTDSKIANNACLPCHQERVDNATEHTHHAVDSDGSKCISCHMAMTDFAQMRRSDHSMRPPMPAASIEFGSPNACNICHTDKDAIWADGNVRKWHEDDYQATTIKLGHLIKQARQQDWSNLSEILKYLTSEQRDEVFAASLILLLKDCNAPEKWPIINELATKDNSVIVRSAAVESLATNLNKDSIEALCLATKDDYRLVRIRAAESMAPLPQSMLTDKENSALNIATDEYIKAMNAHTDDYLSHYNLGIFYMAKKDYKKAAASFLMSNKLNPDSIPPLNNIAFTYNAMGENQKAVESLQKILSLEPNNSIAGLNLGMLLSEMGRMDESVIAFKNAFKNNPTSAVAAYNLGIILAEKQPKESLSWCKKAYELQPDNPEYGYTYAYFLDKSGDKDSAVKVLESIIARKTSSADVYMMLGAIYRKQGMPEKASTVYHHGSQNISIPEHQRAQLRKLLKEVSKM